MTIHRTKQREKVFTKNSKTVRFLNPSCHDFSYADLDEHLCVKIRRCDVFVRFRDVSWLVELKGRHINEAIEQIISCSHVLLNEISDSEVIPVIVASRCPAPAVPPKLMAKLKKECRNIAVSKIILKSRTCVINMSQ